MAIDPFGDTVVALLPFRGENGSIVFQDLSWSAKPVTRYGDTKISTIASKWDNGSCYFDGTGDYLTLPTNSRLVTGSSDFTIEAWFNTTQSGRANTTLISRVSAGFGVGSWNIMVNGDAANNKPTVYWRDYYTGSALLVSSSTGYNDGNWHHIAWVRYGNIHTLYLDGVAKATVTTAASMVDCGVALTIGNDLVYSPRNYAGYLQDVRFSNGVARYTAGFTPPVVTFPIPEPPNGIVIQSPKVQPFSFLPYGA